MTTKPTNVMRGLAAVALLAALAVGCSSDDSSNESTDAGNTGTTQQSASSKPKSSTKTTTTEDESSDTTVATDEGATEESITDETVESAGDSWAITASLYQGELGKKVTVVCAPEGTPAAVWGTETYTDDSSICTAAVHAGLITFAAGGTVTIEITEGEEAYVGSEANGVVSSDYASWGGSFVFVGQAS